MTALPIAVRVTCAFCGRRLTGHPTVTGRYCVNRHRDRNGRRCAGFFVFAQVPERPTCEHRDRLGERYEHDCVGAP